MQVGAFAVLFSNLPLEAALERIAEAGCGAVEIGCGGYPGNAHCDPHRLLEEEAMLAEFQDTVEKSGLGISALACHGNPLHPDPEFARAHDRDFRVTVELAARIGVETVVTFSGCPGDSENSTRPNWVTCAWPPDFREVLDWQWTEKVAPYWEKAAAFARERGVRVAVEPHPGFVVYNPETFWRLREFAGDNVGVNLDPSNLFWQRMDPLAVVEELGEAIFHGHAKDTEIDPNLVARNGVLDTKEHTPEGGRSWAFRVVGRGHGPDFWRALIRKLRNVGYDGALSIEHEDLDVEPEKGFREAAALLRDAMDQED